MKPMRSNPARSTHWPRLLVACLAAANLVALPATTALAANVLNAVSVTAGQNNSQVIKIALKDALAGDPVSFTTSNPHRLVLDFADTSPSTGRVQETLNSGLVRNYQIVPAGARTRVVFNLNAPASHQIRREKNHLLIVLEGAASTPSAGGDILSAPVRFAEEGTPRPHDIRGIDFRRGRNGESNIVVNLSDPGVGIDIQQKGRTIQVDFLNTALPTKLQRRLDVGDFGTPAQLIETWEQGKHTRMVITPRGKWDYAAHQTGSQFVMEVRSLDDPRAAPSDKPQYSGEKLTLNFQNVEVRAVLQVIADFTGLNIIASDTVSGNVTLRLKDVPWDQALDIIMRAKGLDKRTSGNVIWVAPRDELAAKERMELEAKKTIAELEPLHTRTYRLNYIKASDAMIVLAGLPRTGNTNSSSEDATCSPSSTGITAADTTGGSNTGLQSIMQSASGQQTTTTQNPNRVLSIRGGSSFDLTTNTLIVTDTIERHAAVEEVLKNVDVPAKQVMIEARIVVADDTFGRDLGARLGFAGSGKSGETGLGVGDYAGSATNATVGLPAGAPNPNVNLGLANPAGQLGFTVFNASTAAILSLELQALEQDKRGKIVSNPRVVTTNLRPAVILQGEQIPVITPGTANAPPTTTFKDALLCLLVSPQVLNNDDVILDVEVTKDAKGATYGDNVAINAKRIKTQIRVGNGETAILGGIFEQAERNDTEKVPFLGDVPVLGHLFKKTQKSDLKSELLIFLTPRILLDPATLERK